MDDVFREIAFAVVLLPVESNVGVGAHQIKGAGARQVYRGHTYCVVVAVAYQALFESHELGHCNISRIGFGAA